MPKYYCSSGNRRLTCIAQNALEACVKFWERFQSDPKSEVSGFITVSHRGYVSDRGFKVKGDISYGLPEINLYKKEHE